MKSKRILFITWDSPNVMYLETLFLPIFRKLQEQYGYEFHIWQFIWDANKLIEKRQALFAKYGITYKATVINRGFPIWSLLKAKYFDSVAIKKYIFEKKIDTLMPRATTSLAIALNILKNTKLTLVYDSDGFSQDERVDFSALSPKSPRYRIYRKIEKKGFDLAKSIICRSEKAKKIIQKRSEANSSLNRTFVVRNGTAILGSPLPNNKNKHLNMVYCGSIGPQYRIKEVLTMFNNIRTQIPAIKLAILTPQVEQASALLLESYPDLKEEVIIKSVNPQEISIELKKYHIGISLRKASFSMQAVAPIKVSEYLEAGLSVIYSPGIGDLDEILKDSEIAYCFDSKDTEDPRSLINWIKRQKDLDHQEAIAACIISYFSLEITAETYHRALQYD